MQSIVIVVSNLLRAKERELTVSTTICEEGGNGEKNLELGRSIREMEVFLPFPPLMLFDLLLQWEVSCCSEVARAGRSLGNLFDLN